MAHSQSAYPVKSIRFIVPVTTGGPSDIVAFTRPKLRLRSASRW
jgi:tripartite-type tricarboxylate transporter receptor subunit TctC